MDSLFGHYIMIPYIMGTPKYFGFRASSPGVPYVGWGGHYIGIPYGRCAIHKDSLNGDPLYMDSLCGDGIYMSSLFGWPFI